MLRAPSPEYTELSDLSAPPSATAARERFFGAAGAEERGLPTLQQDRSRSLAALLHDAAFRRHALFAVLYTLLWYAFSGVLSVYNKWLFGSSERDFPFPLFVTSIHMLVQYLLASLCLRLFPRLRPPVQPTWSIYLARAVPCGVASALDIGLSNISLQSITLTFFTMCKSSTLGFVLFFAVLFGLERLRLVLVAIIAVISLGVALMAVGEVHFVLSGFLEAIGASAMGGLRWSLTQILLSQERFGMNNPIATMSKLTPIIGATTFVLSLLLEHPFSEIATNKNMTAAHAPTMLALVMALGGVLAFAMVLSEYCLIQRTSVLTLSIAGMLREVAMVGVAHLVFGDSMTPINAAGLLVALFGIGMYNWLKLHDALLHQPPKDPSVDDSFGPSYSDDPAAYHLRQAVLVSSDPYDEIVNTHMHLSSDLHSDGSISPVPSKNNDSLGSSLSNAGTTRRRQSILPPVATIHPPTSASAAAKNHPKNGTASGGSSSSPELELEASLFSGIHDVSLSGLYLSDTQPSPRIKEGDPDPSKTR
ncbi:hypothetical protein EV175_001892 [Coemansia sp. RSA 1933]|nr:hypothetical protein EV175_001892 [Coemansia sp. RSA 1933]